MNKFTMQNYKTTQNISIVQIHHKLQPAALKLVHTFRGSYLGVTEVTMHSCVGLECFSLPKK